MKSLKNILNDTISKFNYIYPPRPEYKIPPKDLDNFDTGEYIVQPKYNGTCCIVFTNGKEVYVYNRHKQPLSWYSSDIEFKDNECEDTTSYIEQEYVHETETPMSIEDNDGNATAELYYGDRQTEFIIDNLGKTTI